MKLSNDDPQFVPDEDLIRRIDAWRSQQMAPISRGQAIADLINAGLRGQVNPPLSLGDKLILSILCGISRKVEAEGMIDPDFLEEAVKGGHSWAIEWEHPSLSHAHTNSQATADFVIRVFNMWRQVEDSFAALGEEEKAIVRQEAAFAGSPKFPGWHGELEANYKSTARFMTDRMHLFPMFAGRSATEASEPVVARYKQMLAKLAELGKTSGDQPLSAAQLAQLLQIR